MRFRATLPLAAIAGLAVAASSAFAAPIAPAPLQDAAPSVVERVELVFKCWETRSGRRRCRTVYVNPHQYNNPNRYPYGSTEWWRAMDRNGSGGYRR